jgi:hypothetical protein
MNLKILNNLLGSPNNGLPYIVMMLAGNALLPLVIRMTMVVG